MRELSLFSGAGGGLLGTKLLGWKHCGYVEFNDYCQRVIAQRIKDGILDEAPIFGDIRAFIREGYAESYQGMVDVVTGGFPCQPFSLAGKRRGADDERNMWPETIEAIRVIRPRFVLLENNPGIEPYLPVVFSDLRRAHYCVHPPAYIAAAAMGAGHLRKRIWIYAHLDPVRCQNRADTKNGRPSLNEKRHGEIQKSERNAIECWPGDDNQIRAYINSAGFSDAERCEAVREIYRESSACARDRKAERLPYWETEPGLVRVVHGVAHAMDRIKALGNGQVPAVVKTAWRLLA